MTKPSKKIKRCKRATRDSRSIKYRFFRKKIEGQSKSFSRTFLKILNKWKKKLFFKFFNWLVFLYSCFHFYILLIMTNSLFNIIFVYFFMIDCRNCIQNLTWNNKVWIIGAKLDKAEETYQVFVLFKYVLIKY